MSFLSSMRRASLAGASLLALCATCAHANTFTVSNLNDSGAGSLRQAVADANSAPGADTITFTVGTVGGIIDLLHRSDAAGHGADQYDLSDLIVTDDLAIMGLGADKLTLHNVFDNQDDSDEQCRIVRVAPNVSLTLSGLTLTNGATFGPGGAIDTGENTHLTVQDCLFSSNTSIHDGGGAIYVSGTTTATITGCTFMGNYVLENNGGAIGNNGTLTLTNCTLSGNSASHPYGGGLFNYGKATVTGCTFSGNTALYGGGIANLNTLTLVNSTLIGNKARYLSDNGNGTGSHPGRQLGGRGGALINTGTATIDSCTFSDNVADDFGTSFFNAASSTLSNTLFNDSQNSTLVNSGGTLKDGGYNLCRDAAGGFLTAVTDKLNVADAKLGPLQDNGGPTSTIALLSGSAAIDAGQTTLLTDQRGVARPQGSAPDIGAFESGGMVAPTATPLPTATPKPTPLPTPTATPLPILSVDAPSVNESNGGAGVTPTQLVFTLSLSKASMRSVGVIVQSTNASSDSATAKSDYVPLGKTRVLFAPGQRSQTVAITILGDTVYEENERVALALSQPVGVTLQSATAEGTILNDDPVPTLSINDVSQSEGNAGYSRATFTVSLSNASDRTISVGYSTLSYGRGVAIGGTPSTAGVDYLAIAPTTLTFSPGQLSQTITVLIKGDTLVEGNEPFLVRLSAPVNAHLAKAIGTGTILNDDSAPPASADSPSYSSGSGGNS